MVASNGLFQSIHNFETGTRVEEALVHFDHARFHRVSAVAFCGIIELTGVVASYYDKALALRIAGQVDGVTTVVETIQIRQFDQASRSFAERRPRPVPFYRVAVHDRITVSRDLSNG